MQLLLLCLLFIVRSAAGQSALTVVRSWAGGCQGTFTVHADAAVSGWTCTLTFASPIDKLDVSAQFIVLFFSIYLKLVQCPKLKKTPHTACQVGI